MKSLFYFVALVLIFIWSVGFIGYGIGGGFHVLLVLALLSVVTRVLLERKFTHKYSTQVYVRKDVITDMETG